MKTIDWKGEYINYDGDNITHLAKYVSLAGSVAGGNGTREKPYNPIKGLLMPTASVNTVVNIIVGNGRMDLSLHNPTTVSAGIPSIVGQSKEKTVLSSVANWIGAVYRNIKFKDLTVENLNISQTIANNCIFKDIQIPDDKFESSAVITNSILYRVARVLKYSNTVMTSRSTFVNTSPLASIFRSPTALLVRSEVYIDATALTYYTNYMGFDNCKFIIGSEATATPLSGNNADEMRTNFVNRCVAQGLTVPTVNEYGGVVSVGRWVFSKTSIVGDYDTLEGSEIDMFAKIRGIYLGHTSNTVKQVPITTTLNIPASFNTQTPVNSALVQENSIGLLANSDITTRVEAYADSKIIWLGGLCKLTTLDLTHNLPVEAGVVPDSVLGFSKTTTPSGSIEVGNHYIIRSNNDSMATIKYNNVEYTSSLITRNNVFLGVTGVTTFENVSGNAEVFQVLDFANHQSIQIRLMREIPTGNITSGNLQAGYWYFVEPNNLSDTSGTITYKNIVRPAFDSFLADAANLTFTVNGSCHLRRCWKQDFDFATEPTDKAFWTDRQKPYYYSILSSDLRCLLKNHSSASVELAKGDDGEYIGSGHPDFYNSVNGVNGLRLPAYDIVGSFLQIRVPITTRNLM